MPQMDDLSHSLTTFDQDSTVTRRIDIRRSRLGVFGRLFAALAGGGPKPERIMIKFCS